MDLHDWERACEQAEEAYAAILKSLHRFEDTLLAPATQPHEWNTQVHRELIGLIEALEQHRRAAAPPAGLIGLIDLLQGHSRGVSQLTATHDRLLDDAQSLLLALGSATKPEASHSPFRRDAAHLASVVREHEAQESALIYETNVRVSGGEG